MSGTLARSTNACSAATAANLDDCSYNASDPILGGGVGALEWTGPAFGSGYYAPGTAPGSDATPVPGDGKTGLPLTGTVTVGDNGDGFGANDLISLSLTLAAGTRNSSGGGTSRLELSWSSVSWFLPITAMNSTIANGAGGFDYILASAGFPSLLVDVATGTDVFPSETGSTSSPLLDGSYWAAAAAAGLASFEGNLGASLAVTAAGWSCDPGADGADCTGRTVGTEQAWNNLLLRISTDGTGSVISAAAFGVRESDLGPGPLTLDSWEADYFTLQPTAVPVPAAVWLLASALGCLGTARYRAAARVRSVRSGPLSVARGNMTGWMQ